jgi:hypothetical protein
MLGEALEPTRPLLAAAQRTGEVTPDQLHLIQRALASVDRPGFDPADITAAETLLTSFATSFGPKELALLADKTIDAINPDGTLAKDKLNSDRRHVTIRHTRDGGYIGELRLTASLGAKLTAVLSPLAKPRLDTTTNTDGSRSIFAADERSHGQRMHDALEEVCDRMLRSDTLPDSGGTPATVIITIDLGGPARPLRLRRHQRRHPDPHRPGAQTGQPGRHPAHRLVQDRECVGSRTQPTSRHRQPNPGVDRPRPRLQFSRLRASTRMVRTSPHHRMDQRR